MKRKTIITISISGIIIVTLALLSLTYGYYLTRIQGNANAKSVEVTSGSSKALYTDLTEEDLTQIITPGNSVRMKFSVKNIGDSAATYSIYLEDVVNEFSRKQDIQYTLYRKKDTSFNVSELSSCTSTGTGTCDIVTTGEYPSVKSLIKANETITTPNDTYTYFFVINYIYSETESQDEDQGHKFAGKIQIYGSIDEATVNKFEKGTLAYAIFENAKNVSNGTELVSTPKTLPAQETSGYKYYTDQVEETTSENSVSITTTYQGYYWTYGTGYTIDESTGKFTLTGVATCKYNDGTCNETLVGKYIVSTSASSNAASTDTQKKTTNLSNIYKVTTAPASSTSSITMKVKRVSAVSYSTEATLSATTDDYGTSYYYRGNVIDNYVNFAGMCWKIVRIAGDESVKLILEDQDSTCASSDGNWNIPTTTGGTTTTGNFGYTKYENNTLTASDGTKNSSAKYLMNYLNGGTNKDKSMATAFKNFQTGPLANYLDKLKAGDWCLNDKAYATESDNTTALTSQEILDKQIKGTTFYYDARVRLYGKTTKEPTLKCNGTNMSKFADNTDMYVGTLTADEIVYAGGKVFTSNPDYYLINDYQKSNSLWFWSLSPNSFDGNYDYAFYVFSIGVYNANVNDSVVSFRPAVTLLSSVQITGGNGTVSNPYTIG